jgi:hypothetical protein
MITLFTNPRGYCVVVWNEIAQNGGFAWMSEFTLTLNFTIRSSNKASKATYTLVPRILIPLAIYQCGSSDMTP